MDMERRLERGLDGLESVDFGSTGFAPSGFGSLALGSLALGSLALGTGELDSAPSRRVPSVSTDVLPALRGDYVIERRDAVEWLEAQGEQSLDLIITDPAYESLEKHRAHGTTTRLKHSKSSSNDWFQIFPNQRFPALFKAAYRALKKDRHFYLFCDQETAFIVKPIAEAAGFKFWKPLVWDKQKIGMGYHYRSRYEFILFFEKGKRKLANLAIPDVLECPRIVGGYPTEKPVRLSQILVAQSSVASEIVADPFLGSGSVGVAALNLGRRFRGCDIAQQAIVHAQSRLITG
ncbi:MAG TPA: site-specific DNA-methyltransferase [Polyangiaceae bacterium]|nr:site-specific DNA-methyltransferase [Polyangiaceae bacterium]